MQQKVRSDAYLDASTPCSQCSRLRLECEVPESFVRIHKRKYVMHLPNKLFFFLVLKRLVVA